MRLNKQQRAQSKESRRKLVRIGQISRELETRHPEMLFTARLKIAKRFVRIYNA